MRAQMFGHINAHIPAIENLAYYTPLTHTVLLAMAAVIIIIIIIIIIMVTYRVPLTGARWCCTEI